MWYSLVLLTAVGVQSIGTYDDYLRCQIAAEEWKEQNVAAGCVEQKDPTEAFADMVNIMQQLR
jgi:hypothetical protein